tara:strand:+ start:204 stop:2639 length:2436 start_codon:yes stop_codon:yes gene_type:complete
MTQDQIDALLDQMTLGEMVSLLAGQSFWRTAAIERLGIPSIKVTDGPNGARGEAFAGGTRSASFPVAIALAATWNRELVREVGVALAQETRSKGASVLLGPTVNMHRSPLNGRNFECFSEDPLLTSAIAVAYIEGVQSQGIAATIKHLVGNESEFERRTISSDIDERSLREIYLPPFEAAVRQSDVWAVMTAYNRLNGTFTSEHEWLLRDVLKGEWGFSGVVMSDWTATHSTAASVSAGLDLEMPGPGKFRGDRLVEAAQSGAVSIDDLREAAGRMLALIDRVGAFEHPLATGEEAIDRPEHRALIRRAGAEAAVLLKNDGVLPLDPRALRKVAVIGPNANVAVTSGGGSARINAHYSITPVEGIRAALGPDVELVYELGCDNDRYIPKLNQPIDIAFYNNLDMSGPPALRKEGAESEFSWFGPVEPEVDQSAFSARLSTSFTATETGPHEFGLMSAGTSRLMLEGALLIDCWSNWTRGHSYFGHGCAEQRAMMHLTAGTTYRLEIDYACAQGITTTLKAVRFGVRLPSGQGAIARAVAAAGDADAVIAVMGLNGDWETEAEDRLDMHLAGEQNALIAALAAANPNLVVVLQTGSPVTMPWIDLVPAVLQAWYPGQEVGNAIADVVFGRVDPGGRLPQTFPLALEHNPAFLNYPGEGGRVRYGEGIYIGYRFYEKTDRNVLFPFGHGLSYASFTYGEPEVLRGPDAISVRLTVTNVSHRAGQDVVQLYLQDRGEMQMRPVKELKAFAKVALGPGESAEISLDLSERDFCIFDVETRAWKHGTGAFHAHIGRSSQNIERVVDLGEVHLATPH